MKYGFKWSNALLIHRWKNFLHSIMCFSHTDSQSLEVYLLYNDIFVWCRLTYFFFPLKIIFEYRTLKMDWIVLKRLTQLSICVKMKFFVLSYNLTFLYEKNHLIASCESKLQPNYLQKVLIKSLILPLHPESN